MYNVKTSEQKRLFVCACKMFIIDFKARSEDELYSIKVMDSYKCLLEFLDTAIEIGCISDYDYNEMCYAFDYIVQCFFKKIRKYHYTNTADIW